MTNETDPREEIVARAICLWVCGEDDVDSAKAFTDANWHLDIPEARAILAALDAARPAEPMQEYDATDAIERAIANWSTISVEPPADEEVATPHEDSVEGRAISALRDAASEAYGDAAADYQEGREDVDVDDLTASIPVKQALHIATLIERQQAEIARLTAERDEAVAREVTAGIRENAAEDARVSAEARATAAEAEIADLRARLADFAARLDNSCNALQDIEDPGDGLRHIDRLVLRREVARIGQVSDECAALAAIKEDRT